MRKFKVGDRVRRIYVNVQNIKVGLIGTIASIITTDSCIVYWDNGISTEVLQGKYKTYHYSINSYYQKTIPKRRGN